MLDRVQLREMLTFLKIAAIAAVSKFGLLIAGAFLSGQSISQSTVLEFAAAVCAVMLNVYLVTRAQRRGLDILWIAGSLFGVLYGGFRYFRRLALVVSGNILLSIICLFRLAMSTEHVSVQMEDSARDYYSEFN